MISVKEGAHRCTAHPVSKKEPISPGTLQKIAKRFGASTNNLPDLRIASMCVLSFAAFLRFSELVNLRRSDIDLYEEHVTLYVAKSKTDKHKQGSHVNISKTGKCTCPYEMLKMYLQKAGIPSESDCYIFRAITFCKKNNCYRLRNSGPLSYTRARDLLLSALESLGIDKSKFGLHSLPAGGATAAANAGVNDRLFKKHGRWRSENAKDGYVKEDLKSLLSVFKSLDI